MKTKILVIGRHPQILETLIKLVNQNPDWEGVGAEEAAAALRLFAEQTFDLVLLSSGVSEEMEQRLRAAFLLKNSSIIIIQHYGGGSGLLTGEIMQALENRK